MKITVNEGGEGEESAVFVNPAQSVLHIRVHMFELS